MKCFSYYSLRTTKQKLFKQVQPMGKNEFSLLINPIIAQCRGVDLDLAKEKQILNSNEVFAFLEKVGEPLEEYQKRVVLSGLRMQKKELRRLVQPIDDYFFSQSLNKIIASNRAGNYGNLRYTKILRRQEVLNFLQLIGERVEDKVD